MNTVEEDVSSLQDSVMVGIALTIMACGPWDITQRVPKSRSQRACRSQRVLLCEGL